jgi:phosphopentomutase
MFAVCAAAREALTNSLDPNHHFLRVIARPFVSRKEPLPSGEKYIRVASFRRDYVLEVPGPTLLDIAAEAGMRNLGIGKIGEIFSRRGLSVVWPLGRHLKNDTEGIELLLQALKTWQETGIIFVNLVDCDERFGHSNDFMGFARNLMMIDSRLRHIRRALRPWDILFITADHGNDPTRALTIRKNKKKNERGTDHTREFLFLAALGRLINTRTTLGKVRFADLGATAAQFLGVNFPPHGKSFLAEMLRG